MINTTEKLTLAVKDFAQYAALLQSSTAAGLDPKTVGKAKRRHPVTLSSALAVVSELGLPHKSGRLVVRLLDARRRGWLPSGDADGTRDDFQTLYVLSLRELARPPEDCSGDALLARWAACAVAFAYTMNEVVALQGSEKEKDALKAHQAALDAIDGTRVPAGGEVRGFIVLKILASSNRFSMAWNPLKRALRTSRASGDLRREFIPLLDEYVQALEQFVSFLATRWEVRDAVIVRNAICAASLLNRQEMFPRLRQLLENVGGSVADLETLPPAPGAAPGPTVTSTTSWLGVGRILPRLACEAPPRRAMHDVVSVVQRSSLRCCLQRPPASG